MAHGPVIAFATDLSSSALSELEGGLAVWLIDVAGGRVLAANASGATLLGLEEGSQPPALDAAMPALVRLRALSAGTEGAREHLVFWGRGGAFGCPCRVSVRRDGSRVLATVAVLDEAETGSGREPDAAPGVAAQAPAVPRALRASLAHELKTPVSAIAAAAEIMRDERFGPLGSDRYVGYASDILDSAQHALGLIDRMLADGGATADQGDAARQLVFAEIAPDDVLRAAVSQLTPLAERAGLALSLELTPRLPHLIADATSLRQIVFNLVTNALKFTERGGRITVAAHYGGEGPLTIAVSDTGAGMTEDEVAQLLAGGGSSDRPRAGGGLGLGVPLVRALAEANGGKLTIASTPGQGTTASVVFAADHVIPV
ncbi:HAMP domain-containing sensor histidine kinase [Hyphomicrobium sp. CS1GBMeth3]|uniref:sensor histidine kinase n=1 Tax=Hyphomicrobium sp. CS1GBMeth3 TaxID=1892845 RepID=UPI00093117FF|nr:HAMP domain-containing sensor histidine kinase [Hyphomicrobium sp. CS1GBMeth3]